MRGKAVFSAPGGGDSVFGRMPQAEIVRQNSRIGGYAGRMNRSMDDCRIFYLRKKRFFTRSLLIIKDTGKMKRFDKQIDDAA